MNRFSTFLPVLAALGVSACGAGAGPSAPSTPSGPTSPPPSPPAVGSSLVSESPCAGIEVETTAVVAAGGQLSTTVDLRWGPESRNVLMDWQTPYSRREVRGGVLSSWRRDGLLVELDLTIVRWHIESTFAITRHSMEIAWPRNEEIGLRFRSDAGQCVDEPTLLCDQSGCEIRR